jgi:hypothetical protein
MTAEEQLTIQGLAALIREFLTGNAALIRESLDSHRGIVSELKEQVDQLSQMFFDDEARRAETRAEIATMREQLRDLTAQQRDADDRCATCVLRPRPGAVAPGE